MLVYLALYKLAKKMNNEGLVNEINETYLINKFAKEEEKLKLRPTENNDKALKYLLREDNNEDYYEYSNLIENCNYFKSSITQENHQIVLDGLAKLMFVEILLEREKDDPQSIFESLNSTGLALSQADLIRNYILMRLNRKEQNKIYADYWQVIENLARDETQNTSRVSDYIRDYLTLKNKKIPNKNKVYVEFKARYPTSSFDKLEQSLAEIKNLARHYNRLINPKNENDKDIKLQLEYVNHLEINVAFPFLLAVYADYDTGKIDKPVFLQVLELVQSFIWRRFILSLPTHGLNKIFMSLYDKVELDNYLYSIQKSLLLMTGTQRFPQDKEVIDALKIKNVYEIKAKNRDYLFERLENFDNNERVAIANNSDITIEHIFPQNPSQEWIRELGEEECDAIRENYLHTVGNLTLCGSNAQLGNKPFAEKRDMEGKGYWDSRLWLNKYLSGLEKWDRAEIEKRFELIAERFLAIWQYPQIDIQANEKSSEVNIFDAGDPTRKKLEYAIFFDQLIEVERVVDLYVEVFRQLFDLQPETFFATGLAEKIRLTKDPAAIRQPVAVDNDNIYFIDAHSHNAEKFRRIKQALTIFDLEDELMIKYAD